MLWSLLLISFLLATQIKGTPDGKMDFLYPRRKMGHPTETWCKWQMAFHLGLERRCCFPSARHFDVVSGKPGPKNTFLDFGPNSSEEKEDPPPKFATNGSKEWK